MESPQLSQKNRSRRKKRAISDAAARGEGGEGGGGGGQRGVDTERKSLCRRETEARRTEVAINKYTEATAKERKRHESFSLFSPGQSVHTQSPSGGTETTGSEKGMKVEIKRALPGGGGGNRAPPPRRSLAEGDARCARATRICACPLRA